MFLGAENAEVFSFGDARCRVVYEFDKPVLWMPCAGFAASAARDGDPFRRNISAPERKISSRPQVSVLARNAESPLG